MQTLGVRRVESSWGFWGSGAREGDEGTQFYSVRHPNCPRMGLRLQAPGAEAWMVGVGAAFPGGDTTKSTGRSGRQKAATRRNMRREERVTVQGPVKEQQPDGMSHRGGVRWPKVLHAKGLFAPFAGCGRTPTSRNERCLPLWAVGGPCCWAHALTSLLRPAIFYLLARRWSLGRIFQAKKCHLTREVVVGQTCGSTSRLTRGGHGRRWSLHKGGLKRCLETIAP